METIGDKWCYLQGCLLTARAVLMQALGIQGGNDVLKFLQSLSVPAPSPGPPRRFIFHLQLTEKCELKEAK